MTRIREEWPRVVPRGQTDSASKSAHQKNVLRLTTTRPFCHTCTTSVMSFLFLTICMCAEQSYMRCNHDHGHGAVASVEARRPQPRRQAPCRETGAGGGWETARALCKYGAAAPRSRPPPAERSNQEAAAERPMAEGGHRRRQLPRSRHYHAASAEGGVAGGGPKDKVMARKGDASEISLLARLANSRE